MYLRSNRVPRPGGQCCFLEATNSHEKPYGKNTYPCKLLGLFHKIPYVLTKVRAQHQTAHSALETWVSLKAAKRLGNWPHDAIHTVRHPPVTWIKPGLIFGQFSTIFQRARSSACDPSQYGEVHGGFKRVGSINPSHLMFSMDFNGFWLHGVLGQKYLLMLRNLRRRERSIHSSCAAGWLSSEAQLRIQSQKFGEAMISIQKCWGGSSMSHPKHLPNSNHDFYWYGKLLVTFCNKQLTPVECLPAGEVFADHLHLIFPKVQQSQGASACSTLFDVKLWDQWCWKPRFTQKLNQIKTHLHKLRWALFASACCLDLTKWSCNLTPTCSHLGLPGCSPPHPPAAPGTASVPPAPRGCGPSAAPPLPALSERWAYAWQQFTWGFAWQALP